MTDILTKKRREKQTTITTTTRRTRTEQEIALFGEFGDILHALISEETLLFAFLEVGKLSVFCF